MEEREREHISHETVTSPRESAEKQAESANRSGDEAEAINVCSEKFDPLRALYAPMAPPLPFPNIKCFNNVAEYESFVRGGRGRAKPENAERRRQKARRGVADPERIDRLRKLMVKDTSSEDGEGRRQTPRRKSKPQKNVLTRMPLCAGSPLGELYRCIQERIRVRVHIRTFKGLRGVCSGFVVAFDKFWNMAMVDVDETYREPLLGEAFYHEKALTTTRLFEKLTLQESAGDADDKPPEDPAAPGPAAAPGSCCALAKGDRGTWEPELSEAVKSERCKPRRVSTKPADRHVQPKESQKYGRVHTRHINQLFIRVRQRIQQDPAGGSTSAPQPFIVIPEQLVPLCCSSR